jgi:hypothetical protein
MPAGRSVTVALLNGPRRCPLNEHSNTGLIHASASLTTRLAAVQFSLLKPFSTLSGHPCKVF